MTTRNARDKLDNICNEKHHHRTVEPREQENEKRRDGGSGRRRRGWGGSNVWAIEILIQWTLDTGRRTTDTNSNSHTNTHVHLCSFIRSFVPRITVYPTFQFNLFHFGCGHKRPIFLHKILFTASIAFGMVWYIRCFIRSPIRWSLVCSVGWLVGCWSFVRSFVCFAHVFIPYGDRLRVCEFSTVFPDFEWFCVHDYYKCESSGSMCVVDIFESVYNAWRKLTMLLSGTQNVKREWWKRSEWKIRT